MGIYLAGTARLDRPGMFWVIELCDWSVLTLSDLILLQHTWTSQQTSAAETPLSVLVEMVFNLSTDSSFSNKCSGCDVEHLCVCVV